jgi:TonB family protein
MTRTARVACALSASLHAIVMAALVLAMLSRTPEPSMPVFSLTFPAEAPSQGRGAAGTIAPIRVVVPRYAPPVAVEESVASKPVAATPPAAPRNRGPNSRVITKSEFDAQQTKPAPRTKAPRPATPSPSRVAIPLPQGAPLATAHDDTSATDAYFAQFKQRLREAFSVPAGAANDASVELEVTSRSDGTFDATRVIRSSGNADFDRAVLSAVKSIRMPARPDSRGDIQLTFSFYMVQGKQAVR